MRIVVIGAGIGGLVAAVGLQSDGHEVLLFEREPTVRAVGAGLTLFGNAFRALDEVGLGDVVRGLSNGAMASMRAGQRRPSGAWLVTLPPDAMASMRTVHRVDLHRALAERLRPGTVQAGAAAMAAPDGSPRVVVGDRAVDADLVVIADGIRSRNRAALGLDPGLHYAGYTAWRGVTGGGVDLRGEAGETWGRGQIFGLVPLPDDHVYWFATLSVAADTRFADDLEEVRARFEGWHDPIGECLAATDPGAVLRHDIYDLARPLRTFVRGRVVLLGDAAHAMTPNLGQGAGQGIEDAVTLTLLLRGARRVDLDAALARYSALRVPRTAAILRRSRQLGAVSQAAHPLAVGLRTAALAATPGRVSGALSRSLLDWPRPVPGRVGT